MYWISCMAAGFVPHYVFLLHHLCNRFVLKCELNLPSVDVSSLPQVLNVPHLLAEHIQMNTNVFHKLEI